MESFTRNFNLESGAITKGSAARNIVRFTTESIENETMTAQAGRAMFDDVTMIEIIVPGDTKSIVVRKATAEDKNTYAREFAAYEKNEALAESGTPLEHWPVMTRSRAATLKACNVFTVEHLAGLSDAALNQVGLLGIRQLREQAKVYLETAAKGALPAAIVAERDNLKAQVSLLEQQMASMSAAYTELARKLGMNVAEMSMPGVTATTSGLAPAALPPQTIAPPAASQVSAQSIPPNWETMAAKDQLFLAEKLTGLKLAKVSEARDAIREYIKERDAA